jgi:hypothetical protein
LADSSLQFKVLAIGPLLEQMVDEFTYDGIMQSSVPFHEYTAANKLVTWVQQVRQSTLSRHAHHPIIIDHLHFLASHHCTHSSRRTRLLRRTTRR